MIDATHEPDLRCWVPGAEGHKVFPIQNLPFGIFSPPDGAKRAGVAIGDHILDLSALHGSGLEGAVTLNAFLGAGHGARTRLRARLSKLLSDPEGRKEVEALLHKAADCAMHMPCAIGDYTDFYVGIHHATNVGKQFRPDTPLLPNYKYVPIGYHGRASSVRPSGVPVRRPNGQIKPRDAEVPVFAPCARLDYELELGVWIGPGNPAGEQISIGRAGSHIAGFCLLNDWSARDVQGWEYQPLGPFLAKNFATTISPWVVTAEAMAPFRAAQPARPAGDPKPLPYLWHDTDQAEGGLALELEVLLSTAAMRERGLAPHRVSASHARWMYWTVAQMVTHHASGGCDLQPGDLMGTGTLSGPDRGAHGSLLEASNAGREPVELPSGEQRRFLEDGDEVTLTATARADGYRTIGFGECRATITPALTV